MYHGHAQTSTTANIYSHEIKTADEMAANVLDCILTSDKKEKQKCWLDGHAAPPAEGF
jgi:hypothetical protein